jgi:hypothetical protein
MVEIYAYLSYLIFRDFRVEVQEVDVPEPSELATHQYHRFCTYGIADVECFQRMASCFSD